MKLFLNKRSILGLTLAIAACIATVAAAREDHSLALASSKVSIAGTSNVHDYTASTTTVRLTNAKFTTSLTDPAFLESVAKSGALEAFEISIPVATLKSGKDGLDKNMYKALKSDTCPEISLRIVKVEAGATAGTLRASAALKIAGVERDVTLDFKTALQGSTLSIKGDYPLLMTDYGIKPPTALLGTIRASAKITVSFEAALTIPPTR